ncbi:SDR family NAD(P)-dependent oxidoreductase [Arthrobacter deserti]|uniref:SDR family NAD(P)-dependent oxidoreductase n=1 Tax=Arthrobacter deserti TaxID=1742687 RepID=A0ABX1JR26_9MICC|nr:SDR family NAD(P)-dependent oxidoreductase [Arthrobacter deserti]
MEKRYPRIEDHRDRTAVVTGGAWGFGRAIAAELAKAGAPVVLAALDGQALEQAAQELGAVGLQADVADLASMERLAGETLTRFGAVDILVNNAGVGPLGYFGDLTLADCRWVMDINYWGTVHGITAFLPLLRQNPDGGYILNTASLAAFVPAAATSAYAASKAAVVALSEVLAEELAEEGRIGISVLAPAIVRTNINANAGRRPDHYPGAPQPRDFSPPLRMIEPEEVGRQVVRAIREGGLYVFTHPETLSGVAGRFEAVQAAYRRTAGGSGRR